MKRNITMRTLLCGPNGNMLAGHKYTVDGKQAKTLVEGGFATYDNGEKVRTAGAPETATLKTEETATTPPGEKAVAKTEEVANTDPPPAKKAAPKKRRKRRKKKA